MPKPGYKSLTVHEDNLIEWTNYFERNRSILKNQGIDSVTKLIETIVKGSFKNQHITHEMIKMGLNK